MADLCLPLSAGEETFELHSVQLELEAVGKEIGELLEKQAQLRKWKATLQISRADAHKSTRGSMQRAANTPTTSSTCVFLHRPRASGTRSSQMAFTPAPDPGCSSGRRDPGLGRRLLLLRSSISPPVTASHLSVRWNVTL